MGNLCLGREKVRSRPRASSLAPQREELRGDSIGARPRSLSTGAEPGLHVADFTAKGAAPAGLELGEEVRAFVREHGRRRVVSRSGLGDQLWGYTSSEQGLRKALKRVELLGLKTGARELENLLKNCLPLGLVPAKLS